MPTPIVFVATELDPEVPGGAGVVVAELASRMARKGTPATVILVTEESITPNRRDGVEVVLVPPGPTDDEARTPFLARSRAAAMAVSRLVGGGDLRRVEFQDFDGLAYWALAHRHRLELTRTPLTVRMHGPVDMLGEEMAVVPDELRTVPPMERHSYTMADLVIAPSPPMRDVLIKRYDLDPDRVAVGQPPIPDVPAAEYRRSENPEIICYGRLAEAKGSQDFLSAGLRLLEQEPHVTLKFIGADGWSAAADMPMRRWLQGMIPEHLSHRVQFLDAVDRTAAAGLLGSAWVIVIPSRFESFCLAAHEVRAMGLPLVLADLPAYRPYFSESTGAALYDGSPEDLRRILDDLISDPDLLDRLAAAPTPTYTDPLALYAEAVSSRHQQAQAGLATTAQAAMESALTRSRHRSPVRHLAGRALRLLPKPIATAAVRILPQGVKDRFRRVASWPAEIARRDRAARQRTIRRRVATGKYPDLADPEVSVVIPCYNQGSYLGDALTSIFEQEFDSWEVIVVDDGSTEPETGRVLSSLNLDRVRVLRQENQGLPAARNAGIAVARGQYVVPLDADDELAPDFMTRMTAALGERPAAAFAHCWAELFGDQEGIWVTRPYNPYQLLLSNSVVGCVLLRRRAWESVGGYDETMTSGNEDWELWVRLMAADWGQVQIPRPLFRYRKHGISMSVETEARFETGRAEIARRHPQLYTAEALREHKSRWYPWVTILTEGAPEASPVEQDLDDAELVVIGNAEAEMANAARARNWPLREGFTDMGQAIRATRGKFVLDWRSIRHLEAEGASRLAGILEGNDKALAANTDPNIGPVMWRRWSLVDPESTHEELVTVPIGAEYGIQAEPLEKGMSPEAQSTIPPKLRAQSRIIRQPPEEEGPLPAWASEGG